MMKSDSTFVKANLLAICLLSLFGSVHAADSDWDYRTDGGSVSESHAGKAGLFRSYRLVTTDSIETVVLWYAKRFGLLEDHSLVVAAKAGFSELPGDAAFTRGYGHDTDKRKDYTIMVGSVTIEHAHFTFLHRPDISGQSDVSISLSSVPKGTSIMVVQPIAESFRKGDELSDKEEGGGGDSTTRTESE